MDTLFNQGGTMTTNAYNPTEDLARLMELGLEPDQIAHVLEIRRRHWRFRARAQQMAEAGGRHADSGRSCPFLGLIDALRLAVQ